MGICSIIGCQAQAVKTIHGFALCEDHASTLEELSVDELASQELEEDEPDYEEALEEAVSETEDFNEANP